MNHHSTQVYATSLLRFVLHHGVDARFFVLADPLRLTVDVSLAHMLKETQTLIGETKERTTELDAETKVMANTGNCDSNH